MPILFMKPLPALCIFRSVIFAGLALCAIIRTFAQSSLPIYTDGLVNGWGNGSYNGTYNFVNPSPVHSGSDSISATVTSAYGGIQLNHSSMSVTAYTSISFWLNGGASGGQQASDVWYVE